jgi:hypothetical protein
MSSRLKISSRQQPGREAPPHGSQSADFLRPWTDEDDLSDWETVPVPAAQPHGWRGSSLVIDLDGEQTNWPYREAKAAGVNPIDFLKQLIDNARHA